MVGGCRCGNVSCTAPGVGAVAGDGIAPPANANDGVVSDAVSNIAANSVQRNRRRDTGARI